MSPAQASGDAESITAALTQLAHAEFRLGHYARAQELAQSALTHAAPDSRLKVRACMLLGNCASETYSFDQAEACYHQAADLSRQIGHHHGRALALHGLVGQGYHYFVSAHLALDDRCGRPASLTRLYPQRHR
jgi:tetratricopeptide (TPR) repeat protein